MSYIVEKGSKGFNVREKSTDVLIEIEREEGEARTMCRKMNLGSGFNGWTPQFFASHVNAKFEEA
jgi:hypothetical protein